MEFPDGGRGNPAGRMNMRKLKLYEIKYRQIYNHQINDDVLTATIRAVNPERAETKLYYMLACYNCFADVLEIKEYNEAHGLNEEG